MSDPTNEQSNNEGAVPEAAPETPKDTVGDVQNAEATPTSATAAESSTAKTANADDDRLRRGFSALSKKEKALRQKEADIKAAEAKIQRAESLREEARTNPLKVLEEYGLTYDQLTDFILGAGEPKQVTPEDRVKALEERLEREARERREAQERASAEETERKIATFKDHVLKPGIKGNEERWELVNARGDEGHELVFEVIEQYHEKHGSVLNWMDAADYVEKHLEAEARKLLGLKKFKGATTPQASQEQKAEGGERPRLYEDGGSTLSRNKAGELPVMDRDNLPLDADERTRAIASQFRLWG